MQWYSAERSDAIAESQGIHLGEPKHSTEFSSSSSRFLVHLAWAFLTLCLLGGQASADRIRELSQQLKTAKSAKARVAAVASLGRLKDQRTLAPLVKALRDKNNSVRSLAASALGRLGDARALPALRRAALDKNTSVRKRVTKGDVPSLVNFR